jgi:hypothetical protein
VLRGLELSPVHQERIEESIFGWKEFELELLREDAEWRVDFSAAVIHPELDDGQTLVRDNDWDDRLTGPGPQPSEHPHRARKDQP